MNINIFGVGRSGTTAILLYISYWLVKQKEEIWINNEPFHWHTRRGPTSYIGQNLFFRSGFILSDDKELNLPLKKFAASLAKNRTHVVSKFVAGSGFHNQINELTFANSAVVVVRNVYDVLKSLSGVEWDFFTKHSAKFPRGDGWSDFRNAVIKNDLHLKYDVDMDRISTLEERNALYWYLINSKLLDSAEDKLYFMRFSELEEQIKPITAEILGMSENELLPIKTPIFYDKNIGGDYPLTQENNLFHNKYSNLPNDLIFYLNRRRNWNLPFIPFRTGSRARLSTQEDKVITSMTSKNNCALTIDENSIIHEFQRRIDEKLMSNSRLYTDGPNSIQNIKRSLL